MRLPARMAVQTHGFKRQNDIFIIMFYKKESKSIFFVYVTANLNADALCAPKLKFFSRRAAQRAENLKKCEFVVDKCRSLRYNN